LMKRFTEVTPYEIRSMSDYLFDFNRLYKTALVPA
jgi:hypothetical protein